MLLCCCCGCCCCCSCCCFCFLLLFLFLLSPLGSMSTHCQVRKGIWQEPTDPSRICTCVLVIAIGDLCTCSWHPCSSQRLKTVAVAVTSIAILVCCVVFIVYCRPGRLRGYCVSAVVVLTVLVWLLSLLWSLWLLCCCGYCDTVVAVVAVILLLLWFPWLL